MKKFTPACLTGFVLFATAGALAGPGAEPLAGGYAAAPVAEREVVDAATFAIKAQAQALGETKGGGAAKLELVRIVAAERQVVAGMNYRLKLKVLLNGEVKMAEAVVWRRAWRKPKPDQLTFWIWR